MDTNVGKNSRNIWLSIIDGGCVVHMMLQFCCLLLLSAMGL